jgi:hypothetical protein
MTRCVLRSVAKEDHFAHAEEQKFVKKVKYFGGRLVDAHDDGAPLLRQGLQCADAEERRGCIQPCRWTREMKGASSASSFVEYGCFVRSA